MRTGPVIEPEQAICFERHGEMTVSRMQGNYTLKAGIARIRDVIAQARRENVGKLMIVFTDTSGYAIPSVSMRLGMMREWADAAGGSMIVVMVCRKELIDPQKFGILMAANFGLRAEVFTTEPEAIAWLAAAQ